MAAESDVGGQIELVRNRMAHWAQWTMMPKLERLVFRNPIAMRRSVGRPPAGIVKEAMGHLKARGGETGRPDLLSKFLAYSKKHPEVLSPAGVVGMLISTISGAGDTTAITMTATLCYLLKAPAVLAKLAEELQSAQLSSPVPAYAQTSKLPLLHAVIGEGMRMQPLINMPTERLVPAGGVTIAGTYLPENTVVGCFTPALHLNKDVFGDDAAVFRPERWLTQDAAKLRAMENAHMGFSRGKRVCIGQHIAVLSMKKVIPALLLNFEMTLAEPNAVLEGDNSGMIITMAELKVKLKLRT